MYVKLQIQHRKRIFQNMSGSKIHKFLHCGLQHSSITIGNGFLNIAKRKISVKRNVVHMYLIFPAKSGLIAYSQSYKSFSFIVWIKKTFCLVVMLKVFLTICCCSAEYSVLACAKLIRPRSQ